jgi:hypothetical protein
VAHLARLAAYRGACGWRRPSERHAPVVVNGGERVSQVRERNKNWKNDRSMFGQLAEFRLTDGSRLGDKALGAITEDDLEAFLVDLRTKGRAASTRNQYVQLMV